MIIKEAFKNQYTLKCWEKKGDWELHPNSFIWQRKIDNLVPTASLNFQLTTLLAGLAYTAHWYFGLIDNAGFVALAASDTAAKITTTSPGGLNNGWKEAIQYLESVRQTITFGSASGGAIDSTASPAVFSCNSNFTLYGGFIASSNVKGGTAGTLFGEAEGSNGVTIAPQEVISGQFITATVAISIVSL
jgi:hypothetical protein